jgi:thioredoxin-related protein
MQLTGPVINQFKSFILLVAAMAVEMQQVHASSEGQLDAGMVNPGYVEAPHWFKVSFLDLFEDIAEAADNNKRLMVYYYQDGCPYCKKLIQDNFGQREIAEKTQQYFDVVAINLWGDKEVVVGDKSYTEKQFAEALKVQYTPTLLFFNEDNKIVFRANGYYPPEKFDALLDYIGSRKETEMSYQEYMASVNPQPSTGRLHDDINTVKSTSDFSQSLSKDKYLLVMFEQKQCATCDELHTDIMKRQESIDLLKKFNVAVVDMWSEESITTPAGENMKMQDWVKKLDVKYAPSLVFFNSEGKEVFRSDGYLKAFHVQSVMDYVASGAYLKQSNFQRYIDERADDMRARGIEVDLMN